MGGAGDTVISGTRLIKKDARMVQILNGGWAGGQLIILAARPAMGKTAFALNLMDHAAAANPDWMQDGPPVVLFYSLEMGAQSVVSRMLCTRARVDAHKLKTG